MQASRIGATEHERGFDDAALRFDERDFTLHRGQFSGTGARFGAVRLQRLKMDAMLFAAQFEAMDLVDHASAIRTCQQQREASQLLGC